MPVGETSDFVGNYSWRGFGIHTKWDVGNDMFVGLNFSWQVFYESEYGSFTRETRTVTGTQYRYINAYPIQASFSKHLDVGGGSNQIFIGTGIGSTKVDRRLDFGLYSFIENEWRFSLSPEIGYVFVNSFSNDIFISIKYDYAFKAKDAPAYSALGISLGFAL